MSLSWFVSWAVRRTNRWWGCLLVLGLAMAGTASFAVERGFPFDRELLLDAKPMKGSKRVPVLSIGPKGEAAIDLWCNSVAAQLVVANSTITILAGEKTAKQCDAARMKSDDDLLAALLQVTNWRRDGHVLTLSGGKTLRFLSATN